MATSTAVTGLLLAGLFAALAGPAAAAGPQFTGIIPNLGIYAGTQNLTAYDVSPHFWDPDGDAMTYSPNYVGNLLPNFTVSFTGSTMALRSANATEWGVQYLEVRAQDTGGSRSYSNLFAIHVGPIAAAAAREWSNTTANTQAQFWFDAGCTTQQWGTAWFPSDARVMEYSMEIGRLPVGATVGPNGTGPPVPDATAARVVALVGSTEVLNRSLPNPGERVYLDAAAITADVRSRGLFGISDVPINFTVCAWDGQTYLSIVNPMVKWVRLPSGDTGADLDANAPAVSATLFNIGLVPGGTRMNAFSLSANHFSDADGDPLEFTVYLASGPGYVDGAVTFELAGGVMGFRMVDPNWTGELTLYITGRDPAGRFARSNNFTVNVSFVDHAPLFSGTLANFSLTEGGTRGGVFDAADHFDDPDGLALSFSIVNRSASEGWNYTTLTWDGTMLNVSSSSGWIGTLCFTVRATDVNGSTADSNEVCFDVTLPANTPPAPTQALPGLSAPAGDSGRSLVDLALYFTDDGPAADLTYAIAMGTEAGWPNVRLLVSGSVVTVEFLGPVPPSALTFSVTVSDARGGSYTSGLVSLTIEARPGNHAPTLNGPSSAAVELGSVTDLAVSAADADGDALSFVVITSDPLLQASYDAANGFLSIHGTGLDEATTYQVGLSASDGWGGSTGVIVEVHAWDPADVPRVSMIAHTTPGPGIRVDGIVGLGPQPATGSVITAQVFLDGIQVANVGIAGGAFAVDVGGPVSTRSHEIRATVTDRYGRTGTGVLSIIIAAEEPSPLPGPSPAPPPSVPELLTIQPAGSTSGFDEGVPLSFTVTTSAPLPDGVTVSWYLDDVLVGNGPEVSGLYPGVGHHILTARATNGDLERSVTRGFDVNARAAPPQPPASGGIPLAWLIAALGAALVGVAVVRTESMRYLLLSTLFGSVFSKLKKPSLLDHFVRGALYQEVRREPGLHFEELRRRTGLANGQASYHLRTLEQGGYVRALVQGAHTRFFPTDRKLDPAEYGISAKDRSVLELVADAPGITQRDLSQKLGRSSSSVSRSVSRLATLGYIVTARKDRGVAVFPRPGDEALPARSPQWPDEGA